MAVEVDAQLYGIVRDLLVSWPRATRRRVDDRLASGFGVRETSVVVSSTNRLLAWRQDRIVFAPGDPGGVALVGAPSFFVEKDVLNWAARELMTTTFALGGVCLSRACRCRRSAGSRVSAGRRAALMPPLHRDCGCMLVSLSSGDRAVAHRLLEAARSVP